MTPDDEFLVWAARIACQHSAATFRGLVDVAHVRTGPLSYQTERVYRPSEILRKLAQLIIENQTAKEKV